MGTRQTAFTTDVITVDVIGTANCTVSILCMLFAGQLRYFVFLAFVLLGFVSLAKRLA